MTVRNFVLLVSVVLVCTAYGSERLYNGIELPPEWPPRNGDSASREPREVPYLKNPPAVIPIDVGRQLLVDDFLIEKTDLRRVFHSPEKCAGNPVLKPETSLESRPLAVAAPFSDGCFFDPADGLFKLWYMAGWCHATALAVSEDGLHWRRLDLDGGSNVVMPAKNEARRDGMSIWLDYDAAKETERYKMFLYNRWGPVGEAIPEGAGSLWSSPDGIAWTSRGETGFTRDNTTFFYNPFRKVWVFSHRTRAADASKARVRGYWETSDFFAAVGGWKGYEPVFWLGADRLDRPDPSIGDAPQLYKIDAAAYESLMLGLIEIHYGPANDVCAAGGFPKLTELQVAFSRDGFHWDRSNREPFIEASRKENRWDRGYLTSTGGVCLVVGDTLYFYYGGFRGDETNRHAVPLWSGMYANAATGLAILRRDGFASMETEGTGELLTRPVVFSGKHLFVNVDCAKGDFAAEVVDNRGKAVPGFAFEDCEPLSTDSTLQPVRWKTSNDLSAFAGKPLRFRFRLRNGALFAFWVSPDLSGASRGYVAAGGPGFDGPMDDPPKHRDKTPASP